MKVLFTCGVVLLPFLALSQRHGPNTPFSKVDSLSRTIKYKNDIYRLTTDLTDPYSEPLLKTRAIFTWITENIRYDYRFYNTGKEIKTPECKPGTDCRQQLIDWEKKYLKKIITKRKAICGGYAHLFKTMCDIAGIKSEIISGYAKTKPYQIGSTGPVNHAWNTVWLDSAYHLLDVTWAAGYCVEDEDTGKLKYFVKDFNEYYWFTSFNDLARNHYPQNPKWVLESNYTKERFAANPYYAGDILPDIKLVSPTSGIINAKKGDTLQFKFEYRGYFERLQVNSNIFRNPDIRKWEKIGRRQKVLLLDTLALKKQRYTSFRSDGNIYEFEFPVIDESLYYIEILFDYRRVMRFRVKIDR